MNEFSECGLIQLYAKSSDIQRDSETKSLLQNEQINGNNFILDRDQQDHDHQRPSTPTHNYRLINAQRTTTIHEIIKIMDQHVVLDHGQQPINAVNNEESEHGIIRRFSHDDAVIPDDVFRSPFSEYSSSEG